MSDGSQQQKLDFASRDRERWAMLRSLDIGQSTPASRVRYLVELVAGVAGDDWLRWYVDQIAKRLSLPPKTTRETIADAEELNLLLVRHTRRPDGSNDKIELRVNWPDIATRSYGQMKTARRDRSAARREIEPEVIPSGEGPPPGEIRPGPRRDSPRREANPAAPARQAPPEPQAEFAAQIESHPLSPFSVPPPSSLAWEEKEEKIFLASWDELRTGLAHLLGDASAAVEAAQAHGLPLIEAAFYVAYWRAKPGAWGEGLLHWTLGAAVPGVNATLRWPAEKPEWRKAEAARLHKLKIDREAIERQETQRAIAEEQAQAREREQRLGSTLDAMSGAELRELAAPSLAAKQIHGAIARGGPLAPWMREELLKLLDLAAVGHPGNGGRIHA